MRWGTPVPRSATDPQIRAIFKRPFAEQVAFFRGKLGRLVPTATWRDIQRQQHDRAFMVAGAARADLLADLASAVDRAIADGESLDQFRRRFFEIVERHGWGDYTGSQSAAGRAWRTRIIYRTNAATSYAAGRLAQLKDFPVWIYRHGGSRDPRPQHLAWNGLTLPSDDPFWASHYPPNGWGCSCYVIGAPSMEAARRLGGQPAMAPPEGWDERDGRGRLPGIDDGWDYQPGASVVDEVAEVAARKTIAWPYEIAKAYMDQVPETVRDALAIAQRSQPETGEVLRRYAERALGARPGAEVQPYQTMGLLTRAEADQIAGLTGVAAVRAVLYDWAIDRMAVRHVHSQHGDVVVEQARGQIAISPADFALLSRLVASQPSLVEDGGRSLLRYSIKTAEGEMVGLFEVRTGRRSLALVTLYHLRVRNGL